MNRLATLALCSLASLASAQVVFPNDFEPGSPMLDPVASYFGGVGSFGVRASTTTVHSGRSLELWANFQHDNFFRIAGFQVGALGLSRSALGFPASANTFSITVRPPAAGRLQMIVSLREDDDGDSVFDSESDDEWESVPTLLGTSTGVYNIPVGAFTLANPGAGNGVMELSTTPRLGVVLTFESRASLPGGIIEFPVTLQIDHLGLYSGDQTIPQSGCAADLDNDGSLANGGVRDGAVDINDLLYFLAGYQGGAVLADLDNGSMTGTPDGGVDINDLLYFLAHYEGGC